MTKFIELENKAQIKILQYLERPTIETIVLLYNVELHSDVMEWIYFVFLKYKKPKRKWKFKTIQKRIFNNFQSNRKKEYVKDNKYTVLKSGEYKEIEYIISRFVNNVNKKSLTDLEKKICKNIKRRISYSNDRIGDTKYPKMHEFVSLEKFKEHYNNFRESLPKSQIWSFNTFFCSEPRDYQAYKAHYMHFAMNEHCFSLLRLYDWKKNVRSYERKIEDLKRQKANYESYIERNEERIMNSKKIAKERLINWTIVKNR
jgi:hypothetical protein